MKHFITLSALFISILFTANVQSQSNSNKENTISVSLQNDSEGVVLNWMTPRETNTTCFFVQKSYDGITFTNIESKKAASTSMFPKSYETELLPETDTFAYYRVVLVLMSGERVVSTPVIYQSLSTENIGNPIAQK